jgi:[protein-PII] uridylyltransferase
VIADRREDRLVFDLQTPWPNPSATNASTPTAACSARQRSADEALLLGGQGRDAAQPDPAAQHRGAAQPSAHEPQPINERFSNKAGMIEVASDDLYLKNPHAILETFLVYQTTVGVKGLSARTLRALYNAAR